MKIVFIVLWLLSNGDIEQVAEGPRFDTFEECMAFKHQFDFSPHTRREAPGGYLSYCDEQEIVSGE